MTTPSRVSGEYASNGAGDGEPASDILQQLSDFLFGASPPVRSPKATTEEGSLSHLSPPSSASGSRGATPDLYYHTPSSSLSAATSPRNSVPFLQLNARNLSEEEERVRSAQLYETECHKLTLEEQLRQIDTKIASNATSGSDDPIAQIKMWFEMRQLKANLEKELQEVDQNIKRLTADPTLEESPWDNFVSFLTTSTPVSISSSNNSSAAVSDAELSDSEIAAKRMYAENGDVVGPSVTIPLPPPITFPSRTGVQAVAHVDCAAYFKAVALAIEGATKDIFITCWFLSPELYLIRDPIPNPAYRLDWLLLKKARDGVQVFVILWDETKIAVFKGSKRAQEMLEAHPNVHVIRHPPFTPLYWSHHQKLVVVDQEIAFVGGVDLCFGRYDTCTHPLSDHQVHVESNTPPSHVHCIWPGKDYYNPTVAPMGDITRPFEDSIDRKVSPRMPWHDTMLQVNGDGARDVALNFISRWNHHRQWNENQPFINWKSASDNVNTTGKETVASGTCTCQILRSIDEWSGAPVKEASILQAYLEAIEDADHYIYIENQNFVSSTAGGGVKNLVAVEIIKRIKRAIRKKEAFHVYIMIPLTPDMRLDDQACKSLMLWNYLTISRGGTSILEQLRQDCPSIDPFDYISFYSLRTHGSVSPGSDIVTEQIYVHSKLMIVDDRVVIIGSNNINDRSFMGDRDSELAIMVKDDSEKVNITMNGVPYVANKFAHDLRVKLFKEYLGVKESTTDESEPPSDHQFFNHDVTDPTAVSFYRNTWMAIAIGNTKIYEHVFPGIPRNSMTTMEEYLLRQGPAKDLNLLDEVHGSLVLHPINFLCNEDLRPSIFESTILWDELYQ